MDDQPIEPATGSHGATGNAGPDDISAILALAHEAAEGERARARATAAAIIEQAEAQARSIRDSASAEVAAHLSSAAEVRRAADEARVAAEHRAADMIAIAEAERDRLSESLEADRSAARTSLDAVIRDLHRAVGRLDGTLSDDDTVDVTDGTSRGSGSPSDASPSRSADTEGDDAAPIGAAVRAVMARALGSSTGTSN